MPIHIPGQGLRLPQETWKFGRVIHMVLGEENAEYGDIGDLYVYLTIDQKHMKKGNTGRRPGAHADAYISSEESQIDIVPENSDLISKETGIITHTYIWYDSIPTEFFKCSFPLVDTSDAGSMRSFDDKISRTGIRPTVYPPGCVLRMTPYVVHRCAIAHGDTDRTFLKISVSDKRYAREGNTINPLFEYDWEMTKRGPDRNTPWRPV